MESEYKKRKFDSSEQSVSNSFDTDQLPEEIDDSAVVNLDITNLRQLLLNFEKKFNKNQMMRMKFSDNPEKFMDSEIGLNVEINNLYTLAASPELYPAFIQSGSLQSVMGMITHENTDISINTIGLLQELTDPSTIKEHEESISLIDSILSLQGLELLLQNLTRLDEKNEEDAVGVYNTLSIIENLVEIRPDIANLICSKTHFLIFLIERLSSKVFDSNKLYCSEILCILLQANISNCHLFTDIDGMKGMDAVDALLQILFQYRKKEDLLSDEEECVRNLFNAMVNNTVICILLRIKEIQTRFLELEGFELMIKCIKELKYSSICSIKVIDYAILSNKKNAEKLVAVGGLKYLFPMLLGRGMPKIIVNGKKKSRDPLEIQDLNEDILSIISQLCLLLHNSTEHDSSARLLSKFVENDFEKIDHCVDLFIRYSNQLKATEYQLESIQIAALRAQMNDGGFVEEDEEDKYEALQYRYSKRLEGGLLPLQQISVMLIFSIIYVGKNISDRIDDRLKLDKLNLGDLQNILRECASVLIEKAKSPSNEDKSSVSSDGFATGFHQLLIEWSATLNKIKSL